MTTRSQLARYLRQIGLVGGHHGPRASTATPLSWRSTDHCDPELSVKVNVVLGRPRGEPALAAGLGDHERRNNSSPLPHGLTEPRPPGLLICHIYPSSRPAGCAAAASDLPDDAGLVDAWP